MFGIQTSPVLALGLLAFSATPALALDVGENAPCVVLEQKLPDGTSTQRCIREHEATQTHTLIEFFSISCGACQENLPNIANLGMELAAKATTRFVSIDRDRGGILNYIAQTSQIQGFPVALDVERDAKSTYNVRATPTLFVLDGMNNVVYKHVGVLSDQDKLAIKNVVMGGK